MVEEIGHRIGQVSMGLKLSQTRWCSIAWRRIIERRRNYGRGERESESSGRRNVSQVRTADGFLYRIGINGR